LKGSITEIGRPTDVTKPYNETTFVSTGVASDGGSYYFADKDDCSKGHKLEIKQVDTTAKDIDWKKRTSALLRLLQLWKAAPLWLPLNGPAAATLCTRQMDSKAAYDACNSAGATELGKTSPVVFSETVATTYYFASNGNGGKD